MANTAITPKGWEVLKEAAALLRGLEISTARGTLLEGEYVQLIVDPRWSEETDDYRLLLTCYSNDRRQVDWAGLPVVVEPAEETGGPVFVARSNRRGQAIVRSLRAGAYRFSVSERWFYSGEPIIGSDSKAAVTPQAGPERLAAAPHRDEALWPTLPPTFSSNDTRVLVTVEQPSPGGLVLTFETRHEELAGSHVRFAITRPAGEVTVRGNTELKKIADRPVWSGRWQGTVAVPEPCHLVFAVISDE